jgi:flagellar basal body-associated protein FliL
MSNQSIYTIIAVLLTIFWVAVFAGVFTFMQPKKIDCSLAEISPDYTPEMRKACRENMKHKF